MREREEGGGGMTLPNRLSLRPGLLWLTLNLALICPCLSGSNFIPMGRILLRDSVLYSPEDGTWRPKHVVR
jgi:hypothetical protein